MQTLKRLDDQARQLERTASGPSLDAFIANERGIALSGWALGVPLGGRYRESGQNRLIGGRMKIATFNINNINRRLPNLLAWLKAARPNPTLSAFRN
jgi:hypothetical protein